MWALRRSLTESPGEHRYVVSVPGRGYQFVADVRQHGDEPARESEQEMVPNQGVAEISAERGGLDGETKALSQSSWDLGSTAPQVVAPQTNGAASDTHALSSTEYIGREIKRHKYNELLLVAALLTTPLDVSYFNYSRYIAGGSQAGVISLAGVPYSYYHGTTH